MTIRSESFECGLVLPSCEGEPGFYFRYIQDLLQYLIGYHQRVFPLVNTTEVLFHPILFCWSGGADIVLFVIRQRWTD